MVKTVDKNIARLNRHKRVRGKISGTAERPRLNVYRSTNNIYAQLIDDVKGVTLCAASSLDKDFEGNGGNKMCIRDRGYGWPRARRVCPDQNLPRSRRRKNHRLEISTAERSV